MDKPTLEADALVIAGSVLDGSLDPNEGCRQLAEICHSLNDPESLAVFSLLAHEQTGHDHIGITAQILIPEILEACRALTHRG